MLIEKNDEKESVDLTKYSRQIKFLYKFVQGSVNFSFGVCVGELAGLPPTVLERAEVKAKVFQEKLDKVRALKNKAENK